MMPIVPATMPDARLTLCGGSPGPEVRALASPWCEVTGSVPDIRVFQKRASVFANALFHGAGSSLKVPEALAAGLPIISTNTGVRGYELRAGEDCATKRLTRSRRRSSTSFAHPRRRRARRSHASSSRSARLDAHR